MKKLLLYILPAVLFLGACTKDISRFNVNTKAPTIVPAGPVFTLCYQESL